MGRACRGMAVMKWCPRSRGNDVAAARAAHIEKALVSRQPRRAPRRASTGEYSIQAGAERRLAGQRSQARRVKGGSIISLPPWRRRKLIVAMSVRDARSIPMAQHVDGGAELMACAADAFPACRDLASMVGRGEGDSGDFTGAGAFQHIKEHRLDFIGIRRAVGCDADSRHRHDLVAHGLAFFRSSRHFRHRARAPLRPFALRSFAVRRAFVFCAPRRPISLMNFCPRIARTLFPAWPSGL